jgi:hypothetical protein
MAMIGNIRPVSDAEIARLLARPAEVTRFLYGSAAATCERVVLDSAWHAIHFVLTGSRLGGDAPLNFLVAEGTPIGDVDVGYGPARVMTSPEVRELARALIEIPPDEVGRRVDPAMLEAEAIYPGKWQSNGYDVEYVVGHYREMREMIVRAAENGLGIVLYIN